MATTTSITTTYAGEFKDKINLKNFYLQFFQQDLS